MLPVPQSCPASTISLDQVLIKILALHNFPGTFPSPGMVSNQVLQEHVVTTLQGREGLGVGFPLLPTRDVPPGHGLLPVVQELSPRVVRCIVARQDWEAITHLSTKDGHGGGHPSVWIRSVTVRQNGPVETVNIQRSRRSTILCNQPLNLLYSQLCPAVRMGVCH